MRTARRNISQGRGVFFLAALRGPVIGDFADASSIPSFSDDAEGLRESRVLAQDFLVSLDERPQSFLWHVGNEIVEQAVSMVKSGL